jgi:homoserine/homoserine lactone efflux protein
VHAVALALEGGEGKPPKSAAMHVSTLVAFAALETLLCVTPGPAVLMVIGYALRADRRDAFLAIAGILSGNLTYFGLAAVGLGTIAQINHGLLVAIQWAGAAYLLYLGISMLRAPAHDEQPPSRLARSPLIAAYTMQLSNPKAIIFVVALLPQFIDLQLAVWPQVLALAIISVCAESIVLSIYTSAARGVRRFVTGGRALALLERAGGVALIAIAVTVAVRSLA